MARQNKNKINDGSDELENQGQSNRRNSKPKQRKRGNSKPNGSVHPVVTGEFDNDPNWYIYNPQMLKDTMAMASDIALGSPINLGYYHDKNVTDQSVQIKMDQPGIMVFDVLPVLPTGDKFTHAIKVAGDVSFQANQTKSGRSAQYDPADQMLYYIAHADLLSYYQWVCRLYGTMRYYSVTNRYIPKTLIEAMHVDFENLNANMANLRAGINQLAAKIGSLVIPKSIDYINRKVFLYESIYTDAQDTRAQLYLYNPTGFLKWTEGTGAVQTSLEFKPFSKNMTVEAVLWYGNVMADALLSSQDVRYIGADLLNTFGTGAMYKIYPIAETYSVAPIYSKEVLSQMENAYICPPFNFNQPATISIKENPEINNGGLVTEVQYVISEDLPLDYKFMYKNEGPISFDMDQYLLNFHENPTPELGIVATRLTHIPTLTLVEDGEAGDLVEVKVTNIQQTEIIVGVRMVVEPSGSDLANGNEVGLCSYLRLYNTYTSAVAPMLNHLAHLAAFNWHPAVTVFIGSAGSKGVIMPQRFIQLDQFTLVSKDQLENANYMAVLSLFTPKALGNLITVSR